MEGRKAKVLQCSAGVQESYSTGEVQYRSVLTVHEMYSIGEVQYRRDTAQERYSIGKFLQSMRGKVQERPYSAHETHAEGAEARGED